MSKFHNYEEFLNEREANVQLFIDSSRFIPGILDTAKKAKLIKGVVEMSRYSDDKTRPLARGFSVGSTEFAHRGGSSFIAGRKIFTVALLTNTWGGNVEDDLDPAKIILISDSPFNLSDIDEIIAEKVIATNKNTIYTFTRKLVKDYSTSKGPVNVYDAYNGTKTGSASTYYMYFEYTMEKTEGEGVTFDMAKGTQVFKDFLDKYPVRVVSTPIQVKKGTIVFGIPAEYVVDPAGKFTKSGEKYAEYGYALFKTGYIRRMPMWSYKSKWGAPQPGVVGKFNSTTLKGWEESFKELERLFDKLKKNIEKEGGRLITTPEEREKYKGLIAGFRYGV